MDFLTNKNRRLVVAKTTTELLDIKDIDILYCNDSTMLTSIPYFQGLDEFNFDEGVLFLKSIFK